MEMDKFLETRTYKEADIEPARRVYYVLTHEAKSNDLISHRTAKMLGMLSAHLMSKGLISETELDALLLELTN